MAKTLGETSFKKVNTVGDLKFWLSRLDDKEPVFMYSDAEGNAVNKVLELELQTGGLYIIPWEQWENDGVK